MLSCRLRVVLLSLAEMLGQLLFVVKLSLPVLASVLLLLTAEMSVSLLFLGKWWALLLFTAGAAFVSC